MLSGINNTGQIVGTLFETSPFQNPHAFELDSRGVTFLDFPGHRNGVAYGINNSGQIVGYFYGDIRSHAFLDTNGAITTIDIPGLTITGARAINDLGQILVGGDYYDGFLYSNGVFSTIDIPGAKYTYLYGINDAGQIVGFGVRGGILDPVNGFTPIVVPGAQTTIPSGINNVGQIVGTFIDSSGSAHGFVATPVPEAASALLTISGLLVAVFANRKRERLNAILSGAAHIGSCHPHRKAGA
jgi:probable HAF family extracellular repeat protein